MFNAINRNINRISNISMALLFAGVILEIFFPAFKYLTIAASIVVYISILLINRQHKGRLDKVLCVLCSLSLGWLFLREFTDYTYVNVIGMAIVYAFLAWSFRSNTGKWNVSAITVSILTLVLVTVNTAFVDGKTLHTIFGVLIGIMQLVIVLKFLDPILEKLGQEHRAKRLAAEEAAKNKEVLQEGGN